MALDEETLTAYVKYFSLLDEIYSELTDNERAELDA
jgi:hypothetical protein